MSHAQPTVVIVGGGIIGIACAHYLNKLGWKVTVLDQGKIGAGCSHGNCGLVCPSHVLPLTEPGAVRKVLRSLLQKRSPFYVKPRLDWNLWSWFWKFGRRCNRQDMVSAGHARHALLESSLKLYPGLLESESIECEWETRGCLFVYQTVAEWEKYAKTDKLLQEEFGISAVRYDGEELVALEPTLNSGLAGGWHYPEESHLRPDRLVDGWRNALARQGVTFEENVSLESFSHKSQVAHTIQTSEGERSADFFVVATGAWTPLLNTQLGCRIPIQPGKGYSITLPRPAECPAMPLLFQEHKVVLTPMQSGYRLGSTMEFSGYDTTINPRRLSLLSEGASHYLKHPHDEPIEERWYGWRPMTYDGIPIIGPSPLMKNVIVAAGHNMLGLSMAPATGKLVSELLSDAPTHIDATPYSIDRF